MLPWLSAHTNAPFPALESALTNPDGLLAAGGDLSVERLLHAYAHGIFPWYSEGEPILWWSPDPRCVLFTGRVHVSRRLGRRMRQGGYELCFDAGFREVIQRCAEPRRRQPETWLDTDMIKAYEHLHREGHAHSMELWRNGELKGGLYGVSIGRVFFAESMFSREPDASKIVLVALCRQLADWGFPLIDCQVPNEHLISMGAELIPRTQFKTWLRYVKQPGPRQWAAGLDLQN